MVKTRQQNLKVEIKEFRVLLYKLDAMEIEHHTSIRGQIQPDPDQMDIDEKPYIKKDFSCFQITKIPGVSDSRKMNFESGGKIIMPEIPELLFTAPLRCTYQVRCVARVLSTEYVSPHM